MWIREIWTSTAVLPLRSVVTSFVLCQTYFQRTPSAPPCPRREGRFPRRAAGRRGIWPPCDPRTLPAHPPELKRRKNMPSAHTHTHKTLLNNDTWATLSRVGLVPGLGPLCTGGGPPGLCSLGLWSLGGLCVVVWVSGFTSALGWKSQRAGFTSPRPDWADTSAFIT